MALLEKEEEELGWDDDYDLEIEDTDAPHLLRPP